MSRNQRLGLVALAAVVIVAAFAIARSGGDGGGSKSSSPSHAAKPAGGGSASPSVKRITITGGKAAGGIQRITAKEGERVRITVSSRDTRSEVHLHGYNILKQMAPGKPVSFDFRATIEGIFEMELEDTGQQIAKLTVEPS